MLTMTAPKKKKSGRGPGRPPKHGRTDESGRSGKRLSLDIDPQIRAAIDDFIALYHAEEKVKLGVTQFMEKAAIELLERRGVWPRKKGN